MLKFHVEYNCRIVPFWDTLWWIKMSARTGWSTRQEGCIVVFTTTCPLSRFRSSVNTRGNSNSRQGPCAVSFHLPSALHSASLLRLVKLSRVVYDCLVRLSLSIALNSGEGNALSGWACFLGCQPKIGACSFTLHCIATVRPRCFALGRSNCATQRGESPESIAHVFRKVILKL